ncbi:MAG: LuxR C-terminal-related transcriptional regulator [Clostridia bacterium]
MENTVTYISKLLGEKLKTLVQSKVGAIIAPAGYGKTTATHLVFGDIPLLQQHWFTADKTKGNFDGELYDWFLNELENIDISCANQLRAIGYFNRVNRYDVKNVLKKINVNEEHYIIIDNLQYITNEFADILISALATSECSLLHLIVLSQYVNEKQKRIFSECGCFFITTQDLLLSKNDIREFGCWLGVELADKDIESLLQKTDGWIVFVVLYLQKAKEYSATQNSTIQDIISANVDIDSLLWDICWSKIDIAERHFLMYFTVWQTMTYSCFLHISKHDDLAIDEERARALMTKMPLIKFESMTNSFTMHNLFRDFIMLKFNDILAEEKNGILIIAGEFEKERSNKRKAVELFYKARSYQDLLSCDMSGMLMENLGGVEFKEIALDVYKNCDEETLCKFPISALRLCYALYGAALFAEYNDFILKLKNVVEKSGDRNLIGEWMMVSAFRVFPNVTKMTAIYEKAAKLLEHPSKVFTYEEPYLFGCTSMWYLFYSQVGQMEKVADEIDKMIARYNTLTNGQAAGAEMLYRGEAYCVQGRFDEAEILVRTAARMAEVKKNVSVVYGSALILGIICVYKDDMIGLEEAVKYLENRAICYDFMQDTALNKYMTETVRGYLLALLLETQDSSVWTREWTCSGTELTFTNFMAKTTQITDLILHKEYKKAIANIEATLKLDKRLISLPTENFMRVGLALCYLAVGNVKVASQNLEFSLSLSEKDKNYTFLACFRKYLAILMMFPSIKEKHKVAIDEIKNLNLSYSIVRKKAIFDFVLSENSAIAELTDRELEVAKLAAAGKRNKEIAKELFVSEYTIKNHLAIIYQKLNIDRRSRLIDMLK